MVFIQKDRFKKSADMMLWGGCGILVYFISRPLDIYSPFVHNFFELFNSKNYPFFVERLFLFSEYNFLKAIIILFSTMVLSIFNTSTNQKLIMFAFFFNTIPLCSTFLYFVGLIHRLPSAPLHFLMVSSPVFIIPSMLIALLGGNIGSEIRFKFRMLNIDIPNK